LPRANFGEFIDCRTSLLWDLARQRTARPIKGVGALSAGQPEPHPEGTAVDYEVATERLLGSVTRRSMLTRGAVGGLALSTSGLLGALAAESAEARHKLGVLSSPNEVTKPVEIFRIATIAEQLAITFYSNGVKNADRLGLDGLDLQIIKAAGIEEQIHQQFFTAVIALLTNGSAPRTVGPTTFSFPFEKTFTDLRVFIATQQVLEGLFDSAFLAAIRELSVQGLHRAAQIAGQVAAIESEHRALGRAIAATNGIRTLPLPNLSNLVPEFFNPPYFRAGNNPLPNPVPTVPPDDWAFAPVFLESVGDAPALVTKAGFLSPRQGNSFEYQPIDFGSPVYKEVFQNIFFREPVINLGRRRRHGR
jgi:hypothetical protein